jgi:hypothetical protein
VIEMLLPTYLALHPIFLVLVVMHRYKSGQDLSSMAMSWWSLQMALVRSNSGPDRKKKRKRKRKREPSG